MPQNQQTVVAAARTTLEQLARRTESGNPFAAAPQSWIDELHEVIAVIAARDAQPRYRLDRLLGIHQRYLHNYVLTILRNFDRLVAENARLHEHAA